MRDRPRESIPPVYDPYTTALDVWTVDPMLLAGADGLALLADGNLYINSVTQSTLLRIDVNSDGSAGTRATTAKPR